MNGSAHVNDFSYTDRVPRITINNVPEIPTRSLGVGLHSLSESLRSLAILPKNLEHGAFGMIRQCERLFKAGNHD